MVERRDVEFAVDGGDRLRGWLFLPSERCSSREGCRDLVIRLRKCGIAKACIVSPREVHNQNLKCVASSVGGEELDNAKNDTTQAKGAGNG